MAARKKRRRVHRVGRRRVKNPASRCSHCRRPIQHAGKEVWRAKGSRVAIRCLDCRLSFCPRCAKEHFAPVMRAHDAIMDGIVHMAMQSMIETCDEVKKSGRERALGMVRALRGAADRLVPVDQVIDRIAMSADLLKTSDALQAAFGFTDKELNTVDSA